MTTRTMRGIFRPHLLAAAVALGCSAQAYAITFTIGEIEGQFDSALSVGASWSVRGADPDLIGAVNGGQGQSQTGDDGRLNFKKGETFSKIFKGIHDLELKYGDTGVFVRGKYWYDFELKDEERLFKDIDDHNRKEGAQASGAQILDAFVYHNYDIADLPGSVRLGKQVLSWGESTFIQNGINAVNPFDVAAFRRPGAEIKEGLIPVNMFYVSQSLTENLSAEAFYQLEWDQTVVDNCGTFFAQADVVADGCEDNLRVGPRRDSSPANAALLAGLAALEPLFPGQQQIDWNNEGILVSRTGDRDPRDQGQYGMALRYLAEELDTEFGLYAMNYHSRFPIFSVTAPEQATYTEAGFFPATARPAVILGNSSYFIEHPEDIHLYGLSFATTLPTGTSWSGELSYRPNAPVQLNTTDLLLSHIPGASVLQGQPGQDLHGYRRKEITQLQSTFIHFFDQVMGADRLTLVGEIGVTHVGGLEHTTEARYGRDAVYGSGPQPNGCAPTNPNCVDDGFVTTTSWGYRARAIWDYPDVFAGVNLKPNISWAHDVEGFSPGPAANFEEGRKAVSLGLDADYQNTYTASLSYTDFFGGKYNTSIDRDFVALSVGMSF